MNIKLSSVATIGMNRIGPAILRKNIHDILEPNITSISWIRTLQSHL